MVHTHLGYISSCLSLAIRAHVTEILRDAGPAGLHVKEIAAPTGINADKLAHVLRLLATSHVFREVAPDTFANNRVSAGLDTGKDIKDILANPQSKYDGTESIAAILEHLTEICLHDIAHFPDVILDPKLTNSEEPNQAAFNVAHKTDLPVFEWLSQPEQAYQSKRFSVGMHASHTISVPGVILKGFDWGSLPKGSIVVDVAGGIGTKTLILAKEFEHLKFVVQDRPTVMKEDAIKFWNKEFPDAVSSGRVSLQVHDMFSPQPVHDASVFIVRAIMHDWSDDYCVKILSRLRSAATANTQLVVIDSIISYACDDSTQALDTIEGARDLRTIAPAPLLPNYGAASLMTYLMDISMLAGLNGHERTVPQFADIFERSGWKLVRVHTDGFNYHDSKAIGVPL
ncbi:S-adenosyl-L-methionine-dependent methyltransferase [Irpex rosettiformis]|uniref:S-adenosyl-L-methionine-dependent methyltransferase n=1 Tax=Irpex rosettiformis TaxID=378272 RepID=A0ACB8TS18_9APHY|nr:S-adenosyl-L-methionine-dependent methyltransferase [Irpex rosettiformis]